MKGKMDEKNKRKGVGRGTFGSIISEKKLKP